MSETEHKMPDKIKLDLKTTLERSFLGLAFVCFFVLVIGASEISHKGSPFLFLTGLAGFVFSLALYFLTDNYYVLDLKKRQLLYRFKFLFFERISRVAEFSGIQAITVDTVSIHSKSGTSHFYVPTLVLFNGKVLPVADSNKEKAEMSRLAQMIAKESGAEFVPGVRTCKMIAIKQPSGRYTFKINPASKSASLFLKVVSVFIILGFFGFIAFIVYNLAVGSNPF